MRREVASVVLLMFLAATLAPATGSPEQAEVQSSPLSDADRNRIFDDLDAEMVGQPDGWTRRVTVLLNDPPSPETIASLKEAAGGFTITSRRTNPAKIESEGRPWTIVPGFSATLTKSQVVALSQHDAIRQIEGSQNISLATIQLDTDKVAAGVQLLRDTSAFNFTGDLANDGIKNYSRNDIVACILDTGIYDDHPDLNDSKVIDWEDMTPTGWQEPQDNPVTPHGTYVAGVLAGQGDANPLYQGVAPGTALVVVKVQQTPAGGANSDVVIDGIDYCVENKDVWNIRIISMSLGFQPGTNCADPSVSLTQAAESAWVNHSMAVVAAAGNGGPGTCTILSPGLARHIITVGMASDPDNVPTGCNSVFTSDLTTTHGWFLHSKSSRGKTPEGVLKPDILAPGTCITSTHYDNGLSETCAPGTGAYCTTSGTSLSAPFVAGVVSMMLHANLTGWTAGRANITNDQIKENLTLTARQWGPTLSATPPYNYDYGAGIVRAYEAVSRVAGNQGTGPTQPTHTHYNATLSGLVLSHTRTLTPASQGWWTALTLITPTEFSQTTLLAELKVQANNPPADGDCPTKTANTLLQRQALITYDTAACGASTYNIVVTRLSGSGFYWLDTSTGGTIA